MSVIWLVCMDEMSSSDPRSNAVTRAIAAFMQAHPIAACYAMDAQTHAMAAQFTSRMQLELSTSPATSEEALRAIAAAHEGAEIVLFASTGDARALLCALFGLPAERAEVIQQQSGAINRINVEPHRIVVAGVNDLCHLQA